MARPKVWLMRNYHDPQDRGIPVGALRRDSAPEQRYAVHTRKSSRWPQSATAFLPEGIDIIDAEALDNASRLKIIADRSVGTDNVDIPAATRNGVLLTNTPGILQDACADMTFALLLSFARQVTRSDQRHQGREVDRIRPDAMAWTRHL